MEPISIGIGVAVLAGYVAFKAAFKLCYVRTPQYTSKVIAGMGGNFKRVTATGGSWKLPAPIETVAYSADLTLQISNFDVNIKTKENNFIDLPIQIHYEIADAIKSARLPDLVKRQQVMQTLAQNVIRAHFAEGDLQAVYTSRNSMADVVRAELQKNMEDYGLTIRDVVVENPKLPAELQKAMQSVTLADRNLEASRKNAESTQVTAVAKANGEQAVLIAQAEGKKAALLAQAEGEGAIAIARAEAERKARILLGEGVAGEQVAIAKGFHDALESMTKAGVTIEAALEYIQSLNNRQLDKQVAEAYAKAYSNIPNAILFADVPNHAQSGENGRPSAGASRNKELVSALTAIQAVQPVLNSKAPAPATASPAPA